MQVRFIDFGNTRKCNLNELRAFRGVSSQFITLPPYCYQCSLVYIQPSQVNAPDGIWTAEDNRIFVAKTDGVELEIEVTISTPIETGNELSFLIVFVG